MGSSVHLRFTNVACRGLLAKHTNCLESSIRMFVTNNKFCPQGSGVGAHPDQAGAAGVPHEDRQLFEMETRQVAHPTRAGAPIKVSHT